MKEFWLWIIVVSLILALMFVLALGLAYNHKLIKKTEVILQRAEQAEKKNAKPRIDPKPDDPDGM